MPPLSHWPDRPSTFDWSRSEVVAYIHRLMSKSAPLDEAIQGYELSFGKRVDVIRFDPETKLWSGNPEWTVEKYQLELLRRKNYMKDFRERNPNVERGTDEYRAARRASTIRPASIYQGQHSGQPNNANPWGILRSRNCSGI